MGLLFAFDENIPRELTGWLEQKGHKVLTLPKGSSDEQVSKAAKDASAILLTQDRHFANTLRFPPGNFPGIVRIKVHPSFIEDIIFSLTCLLNILAAPQDFNGKLIILEKDGFFKIKE